VFGANFLLVFGIVRCSVQIFYWCSALFGVRCKFFIGVSA
jgi:hypothetical protein